VRLTAGADDPPAMLIWSKSSWGIFELVTLWLLCKHPFGKVVKRREEQESALSQKWHLQRSPGKYGMKLLFYCVF
jgi:hypothetical protein